MSVKIGPQATIHRNGLPEELKPLFDWYTECLHENPLFFSSALQSTACTDPSLGYWECVALVKRAAETEAFQSVREIANRVMRRDARAIAEEVKRTEDQEMVKAIMKPTKESDLN